MQGPHVLFPVQPYIFICISLYMFIPPILTTILYNLWIHVSLEWLKHKTLRVKTYFSNPKRETELCYQVSIVSDINQIPPDLSFSSPELKAQVSFSDSLFSVVRPSVHLSVNFSYFSQEPLGQFQSNLAKSILG